MKQRTMYLVTLIVMVMLVMSNGVSQAEETVYDEISATVTPQDGVKEISYEQFIKIRNAVAPFILLDVLPSDSFEAGHIEGAESFPAGSIDAESAAERLTQDARIIVYCGSTLCKASTNAAQKLGKLGFTVLDFKGGLAQWQEQGNQLVK